MSNGNSYTYDANGNMTQRVEGSTTWTQTFDAESRLVSVSDGTTTTTYTYDHAGNRIRRAVTAGGTMTTTIYVAGMEIQKVGSTETQRTVYYSAGGAFRIIGGSNAGLYYRHTDHLGSTSVLSNGSGARVANSDIVYAPFGEVRLGGLPTLTDFGYTGQRHDSAPGGLMYYNARYYLPSLRRFISPDTIIPGPTNPQALNRYSYGSNNPVKYVDPSGHTVCPADMDAVECEYSSRPARTSNPNQVVATTTQSLNPYVVESMISIGMPASVITVIETILDENQDLIDDVEDAIDQVEDYQGNNTPVFDPEVTHWGQDPGGADYWYLTLGWEEIGNASLTVMQDKYRNWYLALSLGVGFAVPVPVDFSFGFGYLLNEPAGPPGWSEAQIEQAIIGGVWTFEAYGIPGFEVEWNALIPQFINGATRLEAITPDIVEGGVGMIQVGGNYTHTLLVYDANRDSADPSVSYKNSPWWLQPFMD